MASKQKRAVDAGQSPARRDLVQAEIDKQAARLFAEKGFAGTSLQDISDAVGMTRQALYYYVKAKDELFAKLVSEITQTSIDDLKAINQHDEMDARARLREIARSIARHRATNPHHFLMAVRSEADLPEKLKRDHVKGKRAVLAEITYAVEKGMSSGEFKRADARTAALAILGMLNWIPWWINVEDADSVEAIAEQISSMAVSSLQQTGSPERAGLNAKQLVDTLRADLDLLDDLV